MFKINDYQFTEIIHESNHSIIYRGIREIDGVKVVCKVLNSEYPDLKEVERLKREFDILKRLQIPGVIKVLALEMYKNSPALILEDFNGKSLKTLANIYNNKIEMFLELALQLVSILGDVHRNKIIHKNIKPSNILINHEINLIKIIDFRFSSLLENENQILINPQHIEGTLEYMSPEQTGRINRIIDYRTDFYSLGITFYELLCGVLPFSFKDPIEILHAHIAKQPLSPNSINSQVPEVISNIVMKMMNKNAEDRYQSAFGLKADLNKCLGEYSKNCKISNFLLGEFDIIDRLQIPQKLYGRKTELAIMLSAFEKISAGRSEVIFVSGFSGIGKTSLVKDIQKTVVNKKGYFVSGKFDQFNKNIPYACIIQAFRELVRQLLTESTDRIEYWKDELLRVLGRNGQVIINVIHELELLIGPQPPVSELEPADAQNRFNIYFLSFVKIFTKPNHPLVLFLDDLQWADSRSLEILELLLSESGNGYLLLICSYRDNEVTRSHSLFSWINDIKTKFDQIKELPVLPLTVQDICYIIADTFHCSREKARSLASIISIKTNGNPFFIKEFIKNLYVEKAIEFDTMQGIWLWNISKITQMNITDNVVELLSEKINKLPDSVKHSLCIAACLGNYFDLKALSLVIQKNIRETIHELMPAIKDGLILPLGNDYKIFQTSFSESEKLEQLIPIIQFKFIHDRVQQAAYSLIEEDKKKDVHLKIGNILLSNVDIESRDAKVFEIVNHLNNGSSLISDKHEKVRLIELNLIAGRKAKASSAFQAALKYFMAGTSLLTDENWETDYELTYSIYLELAECDHLCGDSGNAEKVFEIILLNARSAIDKAKVYEKEIHYYSNLSRFNDSYEAARKALKLFKINLPSPRQAKLLLIYEFLISKIKLRGKKINDLLYLPLIKKEKLKLAVRIISAVLKSAYQIAPELCVANAIKVVNLTLEYGNTEDNAISFIVFGGIFQGGILGKHQKGYDYGKLALSLNYKFNFISQKSEVNFVFAYFSNSWKNHLKYTENYFKKALEAGIETGDFFHTGCAACALCQSLLMRGVPLNIVLVETERYMELVKRIQNKEATHIIWGVQQAILNYKGMTNYPMSFESEKFNESEYAKELKEFGSQHFAHFYFINKMQSYYLIGNYESASKASKESEKFLKYSIGMFHMTEHYFYSSLILCKLYTRESKTCRKKILKQLKSILKKFEKWAEECPANFYHKYLMIDAEINRLTGRDPEMLYIKAIESAREHEFIQNEAIFCEIAATYYSARNNNFAIKLLSDSYYLFFKWGATIKTAKMKMDYASVKFSNF
jgi:predicted ATPase/tRNA A-37 threonylcarbamoyl transferase component Bud32